MVIGTEPMTQDEFARAHGYALLSQLFRAPPDADVLGLYSPPPVDPDVKFTLHQIELRGRDAALQSFQDACSRYTADEVAEEYEALFGSLRNSLTSPAPSSLLAALREHLRACGLAPSRTLGGVEFYVSGVCDVLCWLIEHDRPRTVQAAFFNEFVDTGVTGVCDAIDTAPEARFYRAVASLTRSFIEDERATLCVDGEDGAGEPRT